ncbi:MAG: hypothetical protein BWK79_05630 [Beggiatoa sp. IS2]|nr:MAG: hypothetical protein BWK79_05630 [Beggiatoa sp. IS2]
MQFLEPYLNFVRLPIIAFMGLKNVMRLDDFFVFSSALLCIIDEQNTIVEANAAWEKLFGSIVHTHFLARVHHDDIVDSGAHIAELFKGKPQITFVNRWYDITGKFHWLKWEMNAPTFTTHLYYAVAIDITIERRIEEALRDSRERLRLAVQGSNVGLWDWNLKTNEVYLSPRWKSLLGYQDHEIRNHLDALCQHVHLEDFPKMWATLEAYLDKLSPIYESVYRMRHKNGCCLWVLARASALWDAEDKPYRMVGTYVDITTYKRTEAERDRLFNLSVDMQSIISFDGYFKECNPAWENTLGWSKDELLGKSFIHFIHPADRQATLDIMSKLAEGKTVLGFENRYICKNRRYCWLSWNAYPLVDQHSIYSITRDVTEQKYADEEIRRQQAFVRMVIDSSPNMIFVKDAAGHFRLVNQAIAELFGVSIDDLLNCYNIGVNRDFTQSVSYNTDEQQVINQGETVEFEETGKNVHGHAVWLHTIKKPLVQDDEVLVLGISTDITERKTLELKLTETVAELETILDNSVVGIAYIKHGKFIRVNSKLETLLGYAADELCGLSASTIYPTIEDYRRIEKQVRPLFAEGKGYDVGQLVRTKGGEVFWARLVGKAVDASDLNKGSIWLIEDITLQKQAEQNLRLTAAVFEATADAIFVTDLHTKIQRVNPAFSKITGYRPEEVYGKKTTCLSSGRHDQQFYQQMWDSIKNTGHWQGEIWNRKKTGEVYVAWLSISAITNEEGETVQYMAVLSDISRLQEDIENVRYLANYDSLTGLPNRLLFHDQLLQARMWAHRYNRLFALFFIDLDGFKPVNDQLGHAVGDLLLQGVADRLQKCVRESDTVARFGGDEFTMIINHIRKIEDASVVANKIMHRLQQPFQVGGHAVEISASIGITVYPYDSAEVDLLLKHADSAMYTAKNKGKGCFCFYENMSNT